MLKAIVAGALILGALPPPAMAQNWPGKTVRIVVPHTAAAPFDGELCAFVLLNVLTGNAVSFRQSLQSCWLRFRRVLPRISQELRRDSGQPKPASPCRL